MGEPKDTGGPAFPTDGAAQVGRTTWHFEGMTLRDYLAAKAVHQLLAGAILPADAEQSEVDELLGLIAMRAYQTADAMLKARSA